MGSTGRHGSEKSHSGPRIVKGYIRILGLHLLELRRVPFDKSVQTKAKGEFSQAVLMQPQTGYFGRSS